MASQYARNMWQTMRAYLQLARISNSPTVVTNVLAGAALAGGFSPNVPLFLLIAAMLLFYSGGMILNDACDYESDRVIRPERPLPQGKVSRTAAYVAGTGCLVMGLALLRYVGIETFAAGIALTALIIGYDLWHAGNPFAPLIMAGCRVMVYLIAFLAFRPSLDITVIGAASVLGLYVMGLTLVARFGDRRGTMVGPLIAGISLYDAIVLGFTGSLVGACIAILAFPLTLFLQRFVRGT